MAELLTSLTIGFLLASLSMLLTDFFQRRYLRKEKKFFHLLLKRARKD